MKSRDISFPKRRNMLTAAILMLSTFSGMPSFATSLTLTPDGVAAGLMFTTFVEDFPVAPNGIGPNGTATTSDGNILVADYLGHVYLFNDVDGQTVSDASVVNSEFSNTGSTPALATANGTVYLARERQLFSLNNDGSVNSLLLGGALVTSGGLAANPVTGHLYANSNIDPNQNLTDIDVSANTYSLHPAGGGSVGGVSLDGNAVYVSHFPNVFAFDTTTYGVNWVSTEFSGALGVIQVGPNAGNILGYDQVTGEMYLFDKDDGSSVLVATGGTTLLGGHSFGIDGNNGSLFFSSGDSILRITNVPDQNSTLLLLTFAFGSIIGLRWRAFQNMC